MTLLKNVISIGFIVRIFSTEYVIRGEKKCTKLQNINYHDLFYN